MLNKHPLLLLIIWSLLIIMALDLPNSFWEYNVIEIITFFCLILTWLFFGIKILRNRCKLRKCYKLDFPEEPYPPKHDGVYFDDGNCEVLIPDNKFKKFVRVRLYDIPNIEWFDIRCVQTNKGGNVDTDIIKIVEVNDKQVPPGIKFDHKQHKWGGFDCHYSPPNSKSKEDYLWLELVFDVKKQWEGFLSLEGRDKLGNKRHARACIRFIDIEPYEKEINT